MTNLNKKIIAFDLDGTLAESKQHLEAEMAEVLALLAKEKIVVIISGGSFNQFLKQFLGSFNPKEVDVELIYSNLILLPTSGSRRYQYDAIIKEWIITDTEEMPEVIREKVLATIKSYIFTNTYGIGPVIEGDEVIEDRVTQISLSALGQHAPLEQKVIWDPDQVKRQKIKQELEKILPEVEINIGGSTTLDILPKGFSKAKGLLRLLDGLGMTKEDMIFIGDAIFPGGNDYSPYEAGIECIKTSGPKETKEIIKNWLDK
jgi:HAD superfamily hydrolase (TIGR01484 family)